MAKFMKILVPFDNSPSALRALTKAISLATLSNGTITLVHIISYHKAIAKIVGPYKGKLITHVTKFLSDAQKHASRLDADSDVKILHGSPAEELIHFAEDNDIKYFFTEENRNPKLAER
ncbi:MAG: universal stress protein, partial [Nitrosopumilus sp.]|nr:universal stress protein [Nitrosopumilus sp.]